MSEQTIQFYRDATMDDVLAAYRIFLGRDPEPAGREHYEGLVEQGMSLERLRAIFLESEEYRGLARTGLVTIDLGGFSVCIDPNETDFAPGIIHNGFYEPHVTRAVRSLLRPGQTLIDIGANVGCISFLAASIVGPEGRVVSIEPNPTNLQRLYAGILVNKFTNVRVMANAASDSHTTFSLAYGTSNTRVIDAQSFDVNTIYAQSIIPDVDLDDLPKVDMIKMDIEGHEPFALRGSVSLIERHSPILLTEFAPRCLALAKADPKAYLDEIFELYPSVRVITQYGDDETFRETRRVMDYWRKRDREVTRKKIEPAGMLHFDLVAVPGA